MFDYVKQVANGTNVDLSGYLTTNRASQLYQPKGNYQPAGDYVTQSQLDQALSNYQPSGPYVTQTQLSQAIAAAGNIDLSGFIKKTDIICFINQWTA